MGRNHPVGIIFASLLFGALYLGGAEVAFEIRGFSRDRVVALQGFIVLFSGAMAYVIARPVGWALGLFSGKSKALVPHGCSPAGVDVGVYPARLHTADSVRPGRVHRLGRCAQGAGQAVFERALNRLRLRPELAELLRIQMSRIG